MITKFFGVAFVIVSCGSMGFLIAAEHRREEKSLRQLVDVLDYIECELKYRLTPFPDLCNKISAEFHNIIGDVFSHLALEMDKQLSSDVSGCLSNVLNNTRFFPVIARKEFEILGRTMGKYELEGQLQGIAVVRQDCERELNALSENRENRLRSYQTLGLCAGAALAILLM